MSYQLTINEENGIIELRPQDSVSSEIVVESMDEVNRLSRETGIELLLVDARNVDSMPSIIDVFELTSGFPRSLKMAVLVPTKGDPAEKLKFGETVGVNRGISVCLFDSESEAIDWLKS